MSQVAGHCPAKRSHSELVAAARQELSSLHTIFWTEKQISASSLEHLESFPRDEAETEVVPVGVAFSRDVPSRPWRRAEG
jgi:hypothetical protein